VLATRQWTERERVYNLTIDSLHTFYVAADGVDMLVHNDSVGCPIHGPSVLPKWLTGEGPSGKCNCPAGTFVEEVTDKSAALAGDFDQRSTKNESVVKAFDHTIEDKQGDPATDPILGSALAIATFVVTARLRR